MPFLLCRFPPRSGGGTRKNPPLLGFLDDGGYICQRGEPGVPQGSRWPPGAPLVWAVPRGAPGNLVAPSGSFSVRLRYSSEKYPPSIFSSFGDVLFQQLNVHFSLSNPASATSAP